MTNFKGEPEKGFPKVIDCRHNGYHEPKFEKTFKLILEFFDAHAV